jgi:hypothetical protein
MVKITRSDTFIRFAEFQKYNVKSNWLLERAAWAVQLTAMLVIITQ